MFEVLNERVILSWTITLHRMNAPPPPSPHASHFPINDADLATEMLASGHSHPFPSQAAVVIRIPQRPDTLDVAAE